MKKLCLMIIALPASGQVAQDNPLAKFKDGEIILQNVYDEGVALHLRHLLAPYPDMSPPVLDAKEIDGKELAEPVRAALAKSDLGRLNELLESPELGYQIQDDAVIGIGRLSENHDAAKKLLKETIAKHTNGRWTEMDGSQFWRLKFVALAKHSLAKLEAAEGKAMQKKPQKEKTRKAHLRIVQLRRPARISQQKAA
jgi:hypothetical protein